MHIGFEYGCQTVDDCFILTKATNKPKIRLYIYEKDGKFPHCHITGLGTDGTKEVCVRLDKPKYLYHDDKYPKFSSDEKKMFIDFINSKDRFGNIRWNWFASILTR